MFGTPLKLHNSQTPAAIFAVTALFGTPPKLHSSQTRAPPLSTPMQFGTPFKLHSSQTALTQVCSVFIFWSPLKLRSSQTQGWVCQSVCEALCQSIHFPLHIPHKRERNRLTPIELLQTGFNIMGIANFYIIRERRIRQNINAPLPFPSVHYTSF